MSRLSNIALFGLKGLAIGLFVFAGVYAAMLTTRRTTDERLLSAPAHALVATEFQKGFTEIAARVSPAVVTLDVKARGRSFFTWGEFKIASGSGVIFRPDGYILTNNHVVERASSIEVILSDGRRYEASRVWRDPITEVAVVKIDAENLRFATLGDSDAARVGEWVVAVGHPYELGQTVTAGIVSALSAAPGITFFEDYIQTDAAINPGNSGGPLVNARGEVIGINTAIYSRTGGYQGIGFAIPARIAKDIAEQMIRHDEVTHGFIGISVLENNAKIAGELKLGTHEGILVEDVRRGLPAWRAGLHPGDVILELNDKPNRSIKEFKRTIDRTRPGRIVRLKVMRKGRPLEISIRVGSVYDVVR